MRQTLHIAMAVLLGLGAGGCGELQNEPFRFGTVHGQLTESDSAVALVSVMGSPELRSSVAPDGTFTLEQVPAGKAELFIIASGSRTLRAPLIVQGGQSVTVGPLTPKEASFLSLRVRAPAHQGVAQARVSLAGTPVEQLTLDKNERVSVGPLPDGCYTLDISLPGFPEVQSEACVSAGEHKEVRVNLPAPESGCSVTGCSDDFLCMPDGRCVECVEDAHCGPGLVCHSSRCEGEVPACTSCDGDWQCGPSSRCQELPEGVTACVETCSASESCEGGFTCQAGRCLPDTAHFSGCQAYARLGTPCTNDEACRDEGIVNGICLSDACTFRCATSRECPSDFACEEVMGSRVCVPEE
jgi:hypothetical protein